MNLDHDIRKPLILIADDDDGMRLLMRHRIEKEGYDVVEAYDGLQAIELVKIHHPDLILLDGIMPELNGFDATKIIVNDVRFKHIPVLIVTGLNDDASINRAYDAGASDFINKPINWAAFTNRILQLLKKYKYKNKIQQLCSYDELTNLANKSLLSDRVDHAIYRAHRNQSGFSMLLIDIDRFKIINDSLGREVGDKLLSMIAFRLNEMVRKSDTLARLGADEFVLVMDNVTQSYLVANKAKQILDVLSKPFIIGEHEINMTASVGVSIYPLNGKRFVELLKNADIAMSHVKNNGGNGFVFHTEDMSLQAIKRQKLESDLKQAIRNNEFEIYYQPKYDINSEMYSGAEALVRWNHPVQGLVSPDEFIPLAEETGLICELGEWVIEATCAQINKWHETAVDIKAISINVSVKQLKVQDLVSLFSRILSKYSFAPGHIELEITESSLIDNTKNASFILKKLHDIGLKIALDDFGTGYCSMTYLKDLPIDTVKLDRSFIRYIHENKKDIAIVKAVQSLTSELGLSLVAEGIESKVQLECLKSLKCNIGQGFLWNKPLSLRDFEVNILCTD